MKSANMSVRTFMEEPKLIANPMDRIADIIGKMRETNYWSVPVVQDGKLVGVVDYKTLMAKRFGPTLRS